MAASRVVADGRPHTAIAAPPPPPVRAAGEKTGASGTQTVATTNPADTAIEPIVATTRRKVDADATQLVAPLPPPSEPQTRVRGRSPSSRVIVDGAAIGDGATTGAPARVVPRHHFARKPISAFALGTIAVVAVALVVAIGFTSGGIERDPRAAAAALTVAAPATTASKAGDSQTTTGASPAPPVAAAQPAATGGPPPTDDNSRSAPGAASAGDTVSPAAADSTSAARAGMPTRVEDAPRPARPRAKVQAHNSSRPLAYDPDALFLKK